MNDLPEFSKEEKMRLNVSTRRLVGAAVAAVLSLGLFASPVLADAGFERWIASFRKTAAESGISRTTYDRAFRGVDSVDPEVLEKARFQPEFTAPVWDYFDNRVHENSVEVGRAMARKHKATLDRIEKRFGVDRYIVLAIW